MKNWETEIKNSLKKIDEKLSFICEYINRQNKTNENVSGPIIIENQELGDIIDVSLSTLQRWRKNGIIWYRRPDNTIYYYFTDIIKFLKSDIPSNRRINKLEALKRLRTYEKGIINSKKF